MRRVAVAVAALLAFPSVAHADHLHDLLPRMSERRQYQLSKKFVERLAWCETHGDWQNGGHFAGGLGISTTTWVGFGGRQFARSADRATRREQIIVANRIALWGWTLKNGFFRHPVGIGGWGGAECALPVTLVKRRISDTEAFSRREDGDPYRRG